MSNRRACLLLCLTLGCAGCHKDASPAAGWVQFNNSEGRFAAMFPEEPRESQEQLPLENHSTVFHQFSVIHADGRAFHVVWNDYPQEDSTEDNDLMDLIETLRKGFNTSGKKILSEKPITLNGVTGRELEVDVAGKLDQRVRLFLVHNRLYQVMTYVPVAEKNDPDLAAFLDGFSITVEAANQKNKLP